MTEQLAGQESLFGADTPFTKTYPELSVATVAGTFKPSSRRSSASSSRTRPTFQCLKRANGPQQTRYMAWEQTMCPFPLPGDAMTLNFTASRKDGVASVYWLTSPALQLLGYCLTLNLSECPRAENTTRLSEILVENPDPHYRLSQKACQGILNRAAKRGKELPPELKAALIAQSACEETEAIDTPYTLKIRGGCDRDSSGRKAGKGALIQENMSATLGVSQDQTLFQPVSSSAYSVDCQNCTESDTTNGTLQAKDSGGTSLNLNNVVREYTAGFSFGQSANARSLGLQEEVSPTIRGGEGGNQKPVIVRVESDGETE